MFSFVSVLRSVSFLHREEETDISLRRARKAREPCPNLNFFPLKIEMVLFAQSLPQKEKRNRTQKSKTVTKLANNEKICHGTSERRQFFWDRGTAVTRSMNVFFTSPADLAKTDPLSHDDRVWVVGTWKAALANGTASQKPGPAPAGAVTHRALALSVCTSRTTINSLFVRYADCDSNVREPQ